MKILKSHDTDAKMTSLEAGHHRAPEPSYILRLHGTTRLYKFLKWFLIANAFVLFVACVLMLSYSLWSLYQLDSAMRSRDEAVHLQRYFNRYHVESAHVAPENDSVVIADFDDWKTSILQSLEDIKEKRGDKVSESYNLTFLLQSIADTVKNYVDGTKDGEVQKSGNLTAILRNKLIVTNLTDFEIHVLKEFTKLKMAEREGGRSRRTVRGGPDESECNLRFSVENNEGPVRVVVKPTKMGKGMINIKNTVNDVAKNQTNVRECAFNIIYEQNNG